MTHRRTKTPATPTPVKQNWVSDKDLGPPLEPGSVLTPGSLYLYQSGMFRSAFLVVDHEYIQAVWNTVAGEKVIHRPHKDLDYFQFRLNSPDHSQDQDKIWKLC